MLKIYIIGIAILLIAIVANVLAGILGLMSWYDAVTSLQKQGWAALKEWRLMDYIWLFAVYPFILGLGYVAGNWLYQLFSK
ncbi:MAG: hypothetical protein K2X48_03850 [Chitinophagaceae bacterium]|nr:hypothetical protein [Chitinophagaceae bacterium]